MAPNFKALVTAAFLLTAPACNLDEELEKVEAMNDEIEEAVGVKAYAHVQQRNLHESVTIRLAGPVAGDAAEVDALVEEIVRKHFPRANQIVVGRQ